MNTKIKTLILLGIAASAFLVVSPVFAQEDQPPNPGECPLSEFIVSALSSNLGISAEDIHARMADGETLIQIAQSYGYDQSTIDEIFNEGTSLAVNAGGITAQQAQRTANRERIMQQPGRGENSLMKELGLTPVEMKSMVMAGKTIREIMQGSTHQNQNNSEIRGNYEGLCGISKEEIQSRIEAGETFEEICPGVEVQHRNRSEK